jgi:hypothetical protein
LAAVLIAWSTIAWVSSTAFAATDNAPVPRTAQLKAIELNEPNGQILSYQHLAGSIEVEMRGTRLAPDARIKLKIGSRPGFVELDINRGGISGLKPAQRLGNDFLTYVLWAVSIDGRASNLGEITFEGGHPVPVNLTTPYQTFWLMVTAEPNYAVVDPSSHVVLYSAKEGSAGGSRALTIRGTLFYFTHYSTYESARADADEGAPNQLLQARKALELVPNSAVLVTKNGQRARLKEEEYTREALDQARTFLARAEAAYAANPQGQDVIQFARTAAQSAENARALSLGAVGGVLVRQLEDELEKLRGELAALRAEAAPVVADRRRVASLQTQHARRRAFLRDFQIPPNRRSADDVRIRRVGLTLGQLGQIDLGAVPIGVVREDDVGAGLLHDLVEPLRRAHVRLE